MIHDFDYYLAFTFVPLLCSHLWFKITFNDCRWITMKFYTQVSVPLNYDNYGDFLTLSAIVGSEVSFL